MKNFFVLTLALILGHAQDIQQAITEQCLGCLCYAATKCKPGIGCDHNNACGPFKITSGFWIDGGSPTPHKGDTPNFHACATSTKCGARAVKTYMEKLAKDCNKDGKIDCDDYAIMHQFGGYLDLSQNYTLPIEFGKDYEYCKNKVGGLPHFM